MWQIHPQKPRRSTVLVKTHTPGFLRMNQILLHEKNEIKLHTIYLMKTAKYYKLIQTF